MQLRTFTWRAKSLPTVTSARTPEKNGRRSLMKTNGHHQRSKPINKPLHGNLVQTSLNAHPLEPLSSMQPRSQSSNNCNKTAVEPNEASVITAARKDTGHANAWTNIKKTSEDLLFMMLFYRARGPLSVCTASTIHGRTTTNQTTTAAHLRETLKGKKRFW
jgi:hypothetical protein